MITKETVAQVKERADIVAVVGETVKLARQGRKFIGLCPFHKEKTPSFHVNPDRGFFYCFGCKEGGSAVDFIMKVEGLTFPEAIRSLADRAGIVIEEEKKTGAELSEAEAARRAREELYAVSNLAATFFEHALWGGVGGAPPHPLSHHGRAELVRRGLLASVETGTASRPPSDDLGAGRGEGATARDALQAFRVGYAPHAWDGLATFLKQQGVSPLVAERVGLLVPRSSGTGHYDRFRHRLMFAVVDVHGRVVAFSGRALPEPSADELAALGLPPPRPPAEGERAPAKYINSPESPIYKKGEQLFGLYQARQAVRQQGTAILVEGNFDVVSLHARGIGNVVAPLGTAFTPEQAKLLRRYAPAVTVLFDPDTAGRKATRAARAACKAAGLTAKVARLPAGLDPDAFALEHGAAGVERLLKNARGMLEHLIDEALESDEFGGSSLTEQLARVHAVAALLAEEDDPSLRNMAKTYADRLSSKLVIMGRSPTDLRQLESVIEASVSRGGRSGHDEGAGSAPRPVPHDRARSPALVDQIRLAVLGVLLDFPELLDDPEVADPLSVLEGDTALAVAALRQAREGKKGLYAAEFLAQIAPPIHPFAAGRLASPVFEAVGEARTELLSNVKKLNDLGLKRDNAAIVEHLHRAESLGDAAEEDALMREAVERSRKRHGLA